MSTLEYPKTLKTIAGGPWALPESRGEFDNPLDSRYTRLRQKLPLDEIVKKGSSELEKFILLKEWIAVKLQKHGWSFWSLDPIPNSAELILDKVEQGIRFNCGFYAKVFRECCTALGYPSRIINIAMLDVEYPYERKGNIGHSISEVWSNESNKWIVMDCDGNLHYEKHGIPLSAAEVSEEYYANKGQFVKAVYGSYKADWDHETLQYVDGWSPEIATRQKEFFQVHDAMDYYGIIRLPAKSDYSSARVFAPKGVHPPLVRHFEPTSPLVDWTSDRERFDGATNQTAIRLSCLDQARPFPPLLAQFMTNMEHFDHYVYSLDHGSHWQRVADNLIWSIREGRSELMVKAVNVMNIAGPPARAVVEYIT